MRHSKVAISVLLFSSFANGAEIGVLEDKNFAFSGDSDLGNIPEVEVLFLGERDEPKDTKVLLEKVDRVVRPLFRFDPEIKKWVGQRELKSSGTAWHVSIAGKSYGILKAGPIQNSQKLYSPQHFLHLPQGAIPGRLPDLKSTDYVGWLGPSSGKKTYNPLVISTENPKPGKVIWKQDYPTPKLLKIAKDFFANQAKNEDRCSYDLNDEKRFVRKIVLDPKSVRLKNAFYVSSRGEILVTLFIRDSRCQWGEEASPSYNGKTIYVGLDQKPIYLGTGLKLLDFGDYNSDGQVEVLFFAQSYNQDGYVLFSRQFKDQVPVNWTYH